MDEKVTSTRKVSRDSNITNKYIPSTSIGDKKSSMPQ